jgi:hypothetical protein
MKHPGVLMFQKTTMGNSTNSSQMNDKERTVIVFTDYENVQLSYSCGKNSSSLSVDHPYAEFTIMVRDAAFASPSIMFKVLERLREIDETQLSRLGMCN